MRFRFQKRIRIVKGLMLNLSKSVTSSTVGGKARGSIFVMTESLALREFRGPGIPTGSD
jgi:hypothetical protein